MAYVDLLEQVLTFASQYNYSFAFAWKTIFNGDFFMEIQIWLDFQ